MLPAWALARAEAALTLGHSVPEIETSLIAKGLSPETAAAVVTEVVERRARASYPREPSRASIASRRIAVVVAVAVCLVLDYEDSGKFSWRLLVPLIGCALWVWFSEAVQRADEKSYRAPQNRYKGFGWMLRGLLRGAVRSDEGDQIVFRFLSPWIPWFYIVLVFVFLVVRLSG
jgi:hypothetical protein